MTKLCPIQPRTVYCTESRCAWWTGYDCAVHGPHALAEAVREASPFPLDLSIGKPLVDLAEAISRLDVSGIVEAFQALAPPEPDDGRVGDDGGW